MTQDHKRGLFASLFASKKKAQEELEAQRESHQRLEERIREVLVISEAPKLDPVVEPEPVFTPNLAFEDPGFSQTRVDSVLALTAAWRAPIEPVSSLER